MEKKIELRILDISNSMSQAQAYALLLEEVGGTRHLPVVIGSVEAQAIAFKLKGVNPPRPFTHDLFVSFAEMVGATIKEVFIYKVIEGVFYAYIYFEQDGALHQLDSRTSDAVALAMRVGCPIYTTEEILQTESIRLEGEGTVSMPITMVGIPLLEEALKKAVEDEDYELASRLRDEIRRRQKREEDEKII